MHFYLMGGKQHLDLRGDLVLTTGKALVTARSKSAAPREVHEGKCILLARLTFRKRLAATWLILKVIWRKPDAT